MSNIKNIEPLQDFNWDEFENGSAVGVSREELQKAYDETLNKVADHQVVDGKVISVDKKEVIVNIGYKSDGVIPASEFRYNPDLKPGDIVEVYVENQEDKKGQLVLSHKKARMSKSWERVNAALDNEESRLLRLIRSIAMLLFLTRLSSRLNWKHRRKRLSASLKRVRFLKEQSRTSLLTVYSLTSAVLTDSSTSQTFLGAVSAIHTRLLHSTRRLMSLFLTSMMRRSVLPSV